MLARGLQEELLGPSGKHLVLPPQPKSVYTYEVRDEKGTVGFSDNSLGQSSAMRHLAYLTLEIAQKVCRLAQ